jgi:hypothetical protein
MTQMPPFDPSKMDPKLLMELSQLVRQLPPEQLSRMQSLMHNMMAGFDVRREMEEFEHSLPPGFREKLVTLMMSQGGPGAFGGLGATASPVESAPASTEMNLREARITLLRAVAEGRMSPEDAETALFPDG